MGKGGTGVIKKYNEIYRSRKTFERSLCHVLSGQKVSPLPNFSIRIFNSNIIPLVVPTYGVINSFLGRGRKEEKERDVSSTVQQLDI